MVVLMDPGPMLLSLILLGLFLGFIIVVGVMIWALAIKIYGAVRASIKIIQGEA